MLESPRQHGIVLWINGASYDAAGNLISFTASALTYDAENRITSATQSGIGGMYYRYDGVGRRVQEVEKVFVYDAFGQMAAEYSIGAQSLPCTTCYIATDHLGSTRMVTDQNANVVGRHDYLPFGEEIAANTGGRNSNFGTQDFVNQKFTSQERDGETGLDFFQARYFSAALGRFNSPDPGNAGASLFNPQSWNAYTYVRNNPLVLIDPTGMCDSKNPSCFSIDTSACKWWQIWCWAGGSSGSESGAITPIIPLSLCCQYVIGEPSGPVEQQKPARDFRSGPSLAQSSGTAKQVRCGLEAAKDKGPSIGLDLVGTIPGVGNTTSATTGVVRAAIAIDHVVTKPAFMLASGAYGAYGALSAGPENPTDSLVGAGSAGVSIGLTLADVSLEGTRAIPIVGNFVSGLTGLWDGYQAYQTYQACMAKPD